MLCIFAADMKHKLFVIIVLLSSVSAPASEKQDENTTRKHLVDLVKERKAKFDSFNIAIENRSGIFGNQTKKDIKQANEILIDVVKTDNRIIFELQRLLDYKSYEKAAENYSSNTNTAKQEQYLTAIDNLNNRKTALESEKAELEKRLTRTSILSIVLGLLLLVMTVLYFRRKRAEPSA